MTDLLIEAAGLVPKASIEAQAAKGDAAKAVDEAAAAFAHSGGAVTLSEWTALSPASRAALLAARRAYDASTAVRLAIALMGPQGAAEALAPADGGEARDEMGLDAVLARAAARVGGTVTK